VAVLRLHTMGNVVSSKSKTRTASPRIVPPPPAPPTFPTYQFKEISYPVPRLLQLNEPPTEVELQAIRDSLKETDDEISAIDAEIERLCAEPETADMLRWQRKTLTRHRAVHAQLLSPLRRLPPELLSEIFTHTLCGHFSTVIELMHLSQICSRWRKVALSMPSLWSSLGVAYVDRRDRGRMTEAVSICLSRSGLSMLSFSLSFTGGTWTPTARQFLEIIVGYSHRWRDLSIGAPMSFIDRLFSVLNGLPSLEWLSLTPFVDDHTGQGEQETTVVLVPKLKTLSINYKPVDDFVFLSQQLTVLEVNALSVRSCLSLIASLPSLSSCSIAFAYLNQSVLLPIPTVSHIQYLVLHHNSRIVRKQLLASLTLPLLSQLTITVSSWDWRDDDLKQLADRSRFRLKKLVLNCRGEHCVCRIRLWSSEPFSQLEELEICGACRIGIDGEPRELVRLLSRGKNDGEGSTVEFLLPKLQRIVVRPVDEVGRRALAEKVRLPWEVETKELGSMTVRKRVTAVKAGSGSAQDGNQSPFPNIFCIT
jgi:hypothetical protein